jgi:hypothetical protein
MEKFPSVNDTIRVTTVRDSIVYKDTTIYIRIPGKTTIDSIPIPCPPPPVNYIPKKAFAETPLAFATAWWDYPVIRLKLVQKDTTITERLDSAKKESYYWKTLYEKIHITPAPVKYVPGFYKFCTFAFIGICIVLIGIIVLKILKI